MWVLQINSITFQSVPALGESPLSLMVEGTEDEYVCVCVCVYVRVRQRGLDWTSLLQGSR